MVGTAPAGDEALALVRAHAPDAALVDLASREAIRQVQALRTHACCPAVIALSATESEREVIEAAEAGAIALVATEAGVETLVATVRQAVRGDMLCSPRVAAILRRRVAALAQARHQPAAGVA